DLFAALARALDRMEDRLLHLGTSGPKTAVFDLDNTLLLGDIGDAVFVRLLLEHHDIDFSWAQYHELRRIDQPSAFQHVVSAMQGLLRETIEKATLSMLAPHATDLRIDGDLIPVPRPHPVMRAFIRLLHWRGYRTLVVSASNQISVRIVARECFGIPETDAFGITPVCTPDGQLTGRLHLPLPVGNGKVDVIRNVLGTTAPLIAAGDSVLDLPMLRLCHSNGLVIWAGTDAAEMPDAFPFMVATQLR
ncbi:MAG TPA: HAD family hydrolase, partial [Bacteroidota bacterium]|nr:HAD family hydrolase [Bacteroidota bacterium]